jgi:metal-sulfur cluster biosynthetic enzyme
MEEEKQKVIEALRRVIDPELFLSVYDLGLIYDIQIDEEEGIHIVMTLTTPLCPFADIIVQDVETELLLLEMGPVSISLTFDPPWELTEERRLLFGI